MLIVASSCTTSGLKEGYFLITGEVLGIETSFCSLSLADNSDYQQLETRDVGSIFREEFIIPTRNESFIATISCNGTSVASRAFRYGRDVTFGGEVPFGEIVL